MINKRWASARRRHDGRAMACRLLALMGILAGSLCAGTVAAEAAAMAEDRLLALRLDGSYDPERGFLEATARLTFAGPAEERRLWLAEGMQLNSVRVEDKPLTDFSHEAGEFLLRCPRAGDLELSYSGFLAQSSDPFALAGSSLRTRRPKAPGAAGPVDDCRFLSYVRDFYPHPQLDFAALQMTLRLPEGWNCLGSGNRSGECAGAGDNGFRFANPSAKGMALVCGRFQPIGVISGPLTARLYGWPGLDLGSHFNTAEIGRILSFYQQRFGPLGIQELNVLFRRGQWLGGVSYSGLVVMSVDAGKPLRITAVRRQPRLESALAMSDAGTDLLAHEFAHQWWGGIISWKTTADNWITEGLATYSSIIYMRDLQGEKEYRRIRGDLRRFVKRFAGKAAPAEGGKLRLLFRNPEVYQSQVYAKPALMLAELADTISEAELLRRLRSILETHRYRSLGTDEFLDLLAGGDPGLRTRLDAWILSPDLPDEIRGKKGPG